MTFKVIFIFLLTLLINACQQNIDKNSYNIYGERILNYDILDEKNKQIWIYYHSLNTCNRILFYDSCMREIFKYEFYDYKYLSHTKKYSCKKDTIVPLYSTNENNFYGYIFWDIYKVVNTACCIEDMYQGGSYFVPRTEYPPSFKDTLAFNSLILFWKQKANCRQ